MMNIISKHLPQPSCVTTGNTIADDFVVFTKMYQGGKDDTEIEDDDEDHE